MEEEEKRKKEEARIAEEYVNELDAIDHEEESAIAVVIEEIDLVEKEEKEFEKKKHRKFRKKYHHPFRRWPTAGSGGLEDTFLCFSITTVFRLLKTPTITTSPPVGGKIREEPTRTTATVTVTTTTTTALPGLLRGSSVR